MAKVPTMWVEGDNGPILINKSDFNPKTQKETDAPKPPKSDAESGEGDKVELPEMKVKESKGKFFVVDASNDKPIENEAVDPAGYDSSEKANAAIINLLDSAKS